MIIFVILMLALLILFLQGWLYKNFWNKNLTMEIRFSRKTAYEGENAALLETVTNRKILPLNWLSVKFAVSSHLCFADRTNTAVSDLLYRNDIFCVMPYQRIKRTLNFRCGRRGFYRIKNANMAGADILMTHRFFSEADIDAEITVYPKIIDISELEPASKQLMGDAFARRFTNPDPFQFKGIREYAPTDEFKNINFKASAKTGELMVSEKDYTVEQEIIVVLNLEPNTAWQDDCVAEESIRLAASVAARYIDEGMPVGIFCNTDSILPAASPAHLVNLLEYLARVDAKKPSGNMAGELRRLAFSENEVYVVISAYQGPDFQDAYEALTANAPAMWIVPVLLGDEIKISENIAFTRWDVDRNA